LTREASATETSDAAALDEVIDQGVLAGLRELQQEGEPDLLDELIGAFLEDAPTRLAALREAATQEKAEDLGRAAHALKGSSGSLGAKRMVPICEELEALGRKGDLAHASGLLTRLEAEFERVREALIAEVAG
jgi:HPt (histidine-containing phosphotransfer) domain-containing protein